MNYFSVAISRYPIQSLVYAFDGEIAPGSRVIVDIRNKKHIGYVLEKVNQPVFKVKGITEIIDKTSFIDEKMMTIAKESSFKYMTPIGEILDLCFPPFKFKGKTLKKDSAGKYLSLKISISDIFKLQFDKNETKIVELLLENGSIEYAYALKNFPKSSIQSLLNKDILAITNFISKQQNVKLSAVQNQIVENILSKPLKPHLINGITGSGKTEIYFEIASHVIKYGKRVLILVPEIILTPQLMMRIRRRFPEIKIGMYHSALGASRKTEWDDVVSGNVDLLLGTRSAVWVPMKNIGLIVVDEEQDESYKQYAMRPYYNAVDVAQRRSELEGAIFILSSATPRIETYHKAINGEIEINRIEERSVGEIPDIKIVDMKESRNQIFSNVLINKIEENSKNGHQTFLFVPKKGFASRIQCANCGYIFKCPDCDVPMVYHKIDGVLKCHYCGHTEPLPTVCPICGSSNLKKGGIGTERVEREISKIFPALRIKRMDREEVKDIASVEETLDGIAKMEFDIVVGTKMITKGLDFPNIGLVGVIDADHSLGMPDFRANERTFQLLSQVSGRAGRGVKGEVIIQTMEPENPIIKAILDQNYDAFYRAEIDRRKMAGYPPFKELILITVEDKSPQEAMKNAQKVKDVISQGPFEILGPAESPIFKLMSKYRYQILLKCDDLDKSIDFLSLNVKIESLGFDPLNVLKIDVQPYSF
jgi:primosomal protein N' (replication factor Y)